MVIRSPDIQGEPHDITLQIDVLKHVNVRVFDILKEKSLIK